MVKQNGGDIKKVMESINAERKKFLESENKISDEEIVAATTMMFYNDIDKNQHPIGFYESLKGSFGDLKDENTYKKYAAALFKNTMIFDDAKWNAFNANPDATVLQSDPAYAHVSAFLRTGRENIILFYKQFVHPKQ